MHVQRMQEYASKIFHPFPSNEIASKKWITNSGKYLNNSCKYNYYFNGFWL